MVKILRENNNELKEIPVECIKGATLLSKEEAENLLTQEERMCKGTQQAEDNGLDVAPNGNSIYWLCSKGHNRYNACCVNEDGVVYNNCRVNYTVIGIRPALIFNLKSSNLMVGDCFGFSGYTFKVISNKYALCDTIVDVCPFNEDLGDGNNYKTSYVKQRVDEWLQDAKDVANNMKPDSMIAAENDFGF